MGRHRARGGGGDGRRAGLGCRDFSDAGGDEIQPVPARGDDAAVRAVLRGAGRIASGGWPRGQIRRQLRVTCASRPACRQSDRAIDWRHDPTDLVLRKINSADGTPGVLDTLFGRPVRVFDAHRAERTVRASPGAVVARCGGALARATCDGAMWIGHVREAPRQGTETAGDASCSRRRVRRTARSADGYAPIRYEEADGVGYLHFAFYNGAMSTAQCEAIAGRLCRARCGGRRACWC